MPFILGSSKCLELIQFQTEMHQRYSHQYIGLEKKKLHLAEWVMMLNILIKYVSLFSSLCSGYWWVIHTVTEQHPPHISPPCENITPQAKKSCKAEQNNRLDACPYLAISLVFWSVVCSWYKRWLLNKYRH